MYVEQAFNQLSRNPSPVSKFITSGTGYVTTQQAPWLLAWDRGWDFSKELWSTQLDPTTGALLVKTPLGLEGHATGRQYQGVWGAEDVLSMYVLLT